MVKSRLIVSLISLLFCLQANAVLDVNPPQWSSLEKALAFIISGTAESIKCSLGKKCFGNLNYKIELYSYLDAKKYLETGEKSTLLIERVDDIALTSLNSLNADDFDKIIDIIIATTESHSYLKTKAETSLSQESLNIICDTIDCNSKTTETNVRNYLEHNRNINRHIYRDDVVLKTRNAFFKEFLTNTKQ